MINAEYYHNNHVGREAGTRARVSDWLYAKFPLRKDGLLNYETAEGLQLTLHAAMRDLIREAAIKKKKRSAKEEQATAYHEAGHAVAAYILRRRLKDVSILEGEDCLGLTRFGKMGKSFAPGVPEVQSFPELRPQAEREIMISYAGEVAEYLFTKRHNHAGAHSDRSSVYNVASYLISDEEEELPAYLKWLEIRVRNLLASPIYWPAVVALANELLLKKHIRAKQARAIIKQAI